MYALFPQQLLFTLIPLVASGALPHDDHVRALPQLTNDYETGALRLVAQCNEQLAQHPGDAGLLTKRANLQLDLARAHGEHETYQVAEASFRAAFAVVESFEAHIGIAYALIGQHRFQEALGHARQAAPQRPDSPQVRALLGDLHFALGNVTEASLAYECLAASKIDLASLARKAQIELQQGQVDQAQATFQLAIEAGQILGASDASLAWCQTMIGNLAMERGDHDLANRAYRQALSLDPGSHASLFQLAKLERKLGNVDAAIVSLNSLITSFPRPAYWIELGDTLVQTGLQDEAEKWFALAEADMLLDFEKGDFGHLRELAEFDLAHAQNFDRALILAQQDLTEIRHDSGAYETLAWALFKTGNLEKALDHAKQSLAGGPSSLRILCRSSIIFDAVNMPREAAHLRALAGLWKPSLGSTPSTESLKQIAGGR